MRPVARNADVLRARSERFKTTAEQTRSTFTDESRPRFDEQVVERMRAEIRTLALRVSDLDLKLESALRLLDD
jgi:hypothetical protein